MSYHVNKKGYYGEFGGAFIPEMLYPNIEELRKNYIQIMAEPSFQKEFNQLMNLVTTNETSWFRDLYPYDLLKESMLPDLLERKLSA